jgi:hydroxymethylpyrimidine pyrophosphatase-like HAD family hydrolase
MKKLHLKKDEIIGVGDGYNDFPLLMACGLKVAMGNAVPDLKEIADYIAPSVVEDGVVDIISKFIVKLN